MWFLSAFQLLHTGDAVLLQVDLLAAVTSNGPSVSVQAWRAAVPRSRGAPISTTFRGPSISFAFRFVPKSDRKPVPRIDAHHSEIEVNEFLLGENADGFRVDVVGQVMHRD